MNLILYQGPSEPPWDITDHVPQDSLSLLQADLTEKGLLKASLVLELYNRDEGEQSSAAWRARLRKPGILVICSAGDFYFALYYSPVNLEYDPRTRRYRLQFTSLLDGLRAYRSRDKWWNVLDAASTMATLKDFLGQYLPPSVVDYTMWHPQGMSPMQEDPDDPSWPHFAGFIQPASWLVGKQVDYGTNGPWTLINVMGVARSLVQDDTVFALCLAKPHPWWSTEGDRVLPVVVRATWDPEAWDWKIASGDMFWHGDEADGWWYPAWFGLRKNLAGETGDSALIYTVNAPMGERVVCAWAESPVKKPGGGDEYLFLTHCNLRCVLLDGELDLLDQKTCVLNLLQDSVGAPQHVSPQTLILRGAGYPEGTSGNPAGAVFFGVNGIVPEYQEGGSPEGFGEHGQDGLIGVYAMRWQDDAWIDSPVYRSIVFADLWVVPTGVPLRLLDFQIFPSGDEGIYQVLATRGVSIDGGNLSLRGLQVGLWLYDVPGGTSTSLGGHQWDLVYPDNEEIRLSLVLAVPTGPAGMVDEQYRAGVVFGYVLLDPGEGSIGHEGVFVDARGGALDNSETELQVYPDNAGYMETDIPLDTGGDERHPPSGFDTDETGQNLSAQLRTLTACRMRPFAMRYELDGDTRRVKFLLAHNSFSEYEVFAVAASYAPSSNGTATYTLDGRDLAGELVPKAYGGDFNEAETWRPLAPYATIFANEDDPRSSGFDHQGNFGIFTQAVGWVSFPVARKVCEDDRVYSDMGRLGYQNMMNPDYRYWWNIYNAQRGHLVSPLSWWSFVQTELDYREKTNLDLLDSSWDSGVHGLSYAAAKITAHGTTANRICLVLLPRFPIRGDTHTVSGESYWESGKAAIYQDFASQVKESGFSAGFHGRYWDSLFLGPQGGAILVNIWWDDEAYLDSELLVSVTELAGQWFGAARWRGGLYTDLMKYLRESEFTLGGLDARLGLRELVVPVYAWLNPVRIGSLVNQDVMEDLETREDPELVRYRDEDGNPVPLFWQVVSLRWDMGMNAASFVLKETRDGEWRPPEQSQ